MHIHAEGPWRAELLQISLCATTQGKNSQLGGRGNPSARGGQQGLKVVRPHPRTMSTELRSQGNGPSPWLQLPALNTKLSPFALYKHNSYWEWSRRTLITLENGNRSNIRVPPSEQTAGLDRWSGWPPPVEMPWEKPEKLSAKRG